MTIVTKIATIAPECDFKGLSVHRKSSLWTNVCGTVPNDSDEPPGQPRLVSRQTRPLAGRVGSIELFGGPHSPWPKAKKLLKLLSVEADNELIVDQSDRGGEDLKPLELREGSRVGGNVSLDERYAALRKPRFLRLTKASAWLGEKDNLFLVHRNLFCLYHSPHQRF
jgi:hypothetical protein